MTFVALNFRIIDEKNSKNKEFELLRKHINMMAEKLSLTKSTVLNRIRTYVLLKFLES